MRPVGRCAGVRAGSARPSIKEFDSALRSYYCSKVAVAIAYSLKLT